MQNIKKKINIEFAKYAIKMKWKNLSQEEQFNYLMDHPDSVKIIRNFDVPIGKVQELEGDKFRIMSHDGWIYCDTMMKLDEEKKKVNDFLESRRWKRVNYAK